MLQQELKISTLSFPLTLVTLVLISFRLSSLSLVAGDSADVVHTFVDPDVEHLNHLVVDKNTGRVFVGGINKLYQLSPDLDLIVEDTTGPKNDSTECSLNDCAPGIDKKLTNNVNKALVIDYTTTKLISCGSLFQGMCTVRCLHNISNVTQEVREAVVANDATASTVAFIAPGPPNPPVSQVMYVGATYTANSPYRSEVPAVSSRSLDEERMLEIAETTVTTGTRMFINSLARERFPVNYVYGFSSEGFSYFLTTQPKDTTNGSESISKLVRICHGDPDYYSYTEIPIDCMDELRKYNLVQAAFVGKAGSTLAGHLGITVQEDVLFAVFSESNSTTNRPSSKSALCIYSLKAIKRKFTSNIQQCYAGRGQRGLDFISPSRTCIPVLQTIDEDFCGLDVNTPLGGTDPIAASPVLAFNEHLTAVAATPTDDDTVVFVGTSNGHIRKIIVETPTSGQKYEDVEVDQNSPVNSDLHFDPQSTHLYVMTRQKVSKVKVQGCSVHKTCSDCLDAKDSHCGWCSLENKCSLRTRCQHAAADPFHWIANENESCATISNVTPDKVQTTTATTIDLVIANLPTSSHQISCAFSALGQTLITNATRKSNSVKCVTPRRDLLPSIPQTQHHFTAELSVRLNSNGADLATTNFTFFDCNSYSSCTQCVSSGFPCDWCIEGDRCTHDASENCRNDDLVHRVSKIGAVRSSGPAFCPAIFPRHSEEILIPSGTSKAIVVKANIRNMIIIQTRFVCQFNIDGRVIFGNGQLLADTMYCDRMEFSYTSSAPKAKVSFAVVWGGSRPLDNPENIHIEVYRCRNMADSCGMCSTLAEKYGCGWCQSSESCEVRDQCDGGSGVWLNRNQTCPNPEIHSFEPQLGPWEGGTNVTIRGINLGKSFVDIYAGVTIAGLTCQPYREHYIRTEQIVCRVDGPGTPQYRKGPVIVKVEDFRGESKLSFEFVDPVIESISPTYGPKGGGTVITITGRHLNAGSKIQASIDNLPCSIIFAKTNEIVCQTSASNDRSSGVLKIKFDDVIREYNGTFRYVDDPTIESVESGITGQVKIPKGIPAGGMKISVTGTNLSNVQESAMYVYYNGKVFVSRCSISSNTNMICSSPTIEIPEDVVLDADRPLSLEYGFLMDNVVGVVNLSAQGFHPFRLYPNPTFEEFDEGVKYYLGDYLTINGQNLDRACQESDVVVQIGNSFCNVTSLSRHQLTCRPPPGIADHQELPEVVVVVGGELRKSIGKLSYVSLTDLNTCLRRISADKDIML